MVQGVNNQTTIAPASRSQPLAPGGRQPAPAGNENGLAPDIYSPGGSARAGTPGALLGQPTCRCGSCPACAARAYAGQAQPARLAEDGSAADQQAAGADNGDDQKTPESTGNEARGVDGEVLTEQEQAKVAELKKRDRVVKAHEQAHVTAAGSLVRRGVSLSYEKGPDGRRYAVSGEVSIDTSKEAEPKDTITKMQTVRAAALAPADPSPQDRKVAAAATVTIGEARNELNLERLAAVSGDGVVDQAAEGVSADKDRTSDAQAAAQPAGRRASERYQQMGNGGMGRLTINVVA